MSEILQMANRLLPSSIATKIQVCGLFYPHLIMLKLWKRRSPKSSRWQLVTTKKTVGWWGPLRLQPWKVLIVIELELSHSLRQRPIKPLSPILLPLDMVCDMDGTIASRKEARKKAKKVRFHQRAENRVTETGEDVVVFPAPAKGRAERSKPRSCYGG